MTAVDGTAELKRSTPFFVSRRLGRCGTAKRFGGPRILFGLGFVL